MIAGSADTLETLRSTKLTLEQTQTPTLVWLNGHLGALEQHQRPIHELGLFELHAAHVIGWVTLHRYTSHTFVQDIEQMLKQRWTF